MVGMRICISGAGIAGPALAYWLLHHGHQPTLVEIAPHFRRGGYIIDFWGKGYELAERMGILPRVQDQGYHVREVRIVDEHGRKSGGFEVEPLTRALRGCFASLPRGELASILYDTVKDRVETLFDTSITSLTDLGRAIRVTFSHALPRDFDLVIGADGLHSNVRRLAFSSATSSEVFLGYHVAAFEATGYRPRDELTYVSYSRPGRQIARFAMRDDRTVFMLIFASGEPIQARTTEAQRDVLQRTFGGMGWETDAILAAMQRSDSLYFDRVSQIHADRWSSGRVALLGDAAHCPSLLAGEGCALAIIDAYVLAGELARAGDDYAAAFHSYENRLRGFIESKQRAAKRFAGQFAPRTELGLIVRRWATKAMSLPGLTNLFLGRALRDDLELPDY
jgi:2-polyprenyl-6-methoxyphenol hydroxylase-like FAD-dependent oxidoreductase